MSRRTATFAATFMLAAGLAPLATGTRPALAAPRETLPIRGGYFGTSLSKENVSRPVEVNVFIQTGRRFSGMLNVGARLRDVQFTGNLSAGNRFTLSGRSGVGRNRFQIRVTGNLTPDHATGGRTLEGTYQVTGAIRESGTLFVSGRIKPE